MVLFLYIDLWQYFSKLWTREKEFLIISYFCYIKTVDKIKKIGEQPPNRFMVFLDGGFFFPDVYYLLVSIFFFTSMLYIWVVYGSRFIFIYLVLFLNEFYFKEHYVVLISFYCCCYPLLEANCRRRDFNPRRGIDLGPSADEDGLEKKLTIKFYF